MKFLFALLVAGFSVSGFAQSSIESRLARLEARVAQLEDVSGSPRNNDYCECNNMGNLWLYGSFPRKLSEHYSVEACNEALYRHPSCR